MTKEECLATLNAYVAVSQASWSQLNVRVRDRVGNWSSMDADELDRELRGIVRHTEGPGCEVRVFWKIGEDLCYAGCNAQFARDAGIATPREVIGLTDFDGKMSWQAQASKYRADDREVVAAVASRLDIIERQNSSTGLIWLRTGKAPLVLANGRPIGILGMYEIIDAKTAFKLTLSRPAARRW